MVDLSTVDVETLEAGPALNRLVFTALYPLTEVVDTNEFMWQIIGNTRVQFAAHAIPDYSKDIATAFYALAEFGSYISLEGAGASWLCSNRNAYERTHNEATEATADTPALAIARFLVKQAALKAATAR